MLKGYRGKARHVKERLLEGIEIARTVTGEAFERSPGTGLAEMPGSRPMNLWSLERVP